MAALSRECCLSRAMGSSYGGREVLGNPKGSKPPTTVPRPRLQDPAPSPWSPCPGPI